MNFSLESELKLFLTDCIAKSHLTGERINETEMENGLKL